MKVRSDPYVQLLTRNGIGLTYIASCCSRKDLMRSYTLISRHDFEQQATTPTHYQYEGHVGRMLDVETGHGRQCRGCWMRSRRMHGGHCRKRTRREIWKGVGREHGKEHKKRIEKQDKTLKHKRKKKKLKKENKT